MTVETVNQSDTILLLSALKALKTTCDRFGVKLANNTVLNLDNGFDSRKNRKSIWNAGLKSNIKENPRNRKKTKRGRKRFFDKDLYALRFKCEQTFAWEDKFTRVITQFECLRELAMGFHLLAFALIDVRSGHI